MTDRTAVVVKSLLSGESSCAASSRTPASLIAHLNEPIERELIELLSEYGIYKVVNVRHAEPFATAVHRTLNLCLI